MKFSFLRPIIAAVGALAFVATASAQSLIRDAEIETTLREWTDPILEVAGLNPSDVDLYIINDPSLNAFVANGQNKSENWSGDNPADPLLSSVSVFDSRTANVHVDEVNDVAYTPFPMRVLERLAEACQEVKKRIGADITALEQQTPEAVKQPKTHEGTATAKLIAGLNGNTKEQDVRDLATLNDKEKARLETLKADLGNDPLKAARRIEGQRDKLAETGKAPSS